MVCQNPYEITYDPMREKVLKIKKFMFFGDKGEAKLNVMLDKTVYGYLDTINVKVKMDNSQCTEDVQKFEVTLRQHARLVKTSGWGDFHDRKDLLLNTYEGILKNTETDGYSLNFALDLQQAKNKNLLNVCKDKEVYYFLSGIQPTTIGNKVNIFYTIKIKAVYGNFAAKKLKVIHPVIIKTPELVEESIPPYQYPLNTMEPEEWNPTINTKTQVSLNH